MIVNTVSAMAFKRFAVYAELCGVDFGVTVPQSTKKIRRWS